MTQMTSFVLSTILFLTAFAVAGPCTTLTGKDQAAALNSPSSRTQISKVDIRGSTVKATSKQTGADPNMTDAPDPATPLLIGSGLIALSLFRRRLRRDVTDE